MNIELYIAGQLCDLEKADLGIKLRRQLYNPKELNTKDSQKSYSITLPATARNNEIFGHKNVEETVGKFTLYPDARLYVNNILILNGKFRLSEISSKGYRGNLGVPAPLTAKDVFGERKMNDVGEWKLKNFQGENSFADYNKPPKVGEEPQPCIFPLVLYGLLPHGLSPEISLTTNFAHTDFPPSLNCIQMLKKIFSNTGYTLTGSALDDDRLKHLYVSYKNPEDYIMPFEAKKSMLKASWTNCTMKDNRIDISSCEREFTINNYAYPEDASEKSHDLVACNIFRSDNIKIEDKLDPTHLFQFSGNNLTYKVPKDGLYKIDLEANIKLLHDGDWGTNLGEDVKNKEGSDTIRIVERAQGKWRSFKNMACELKLLRQKEDPKYDLTNTKMDCIFYQNNQKQKLDSIKPIFPLPGCVNFIDQAQNPDMLCGFSWGRVVSNNTKYQHEVGKNEIIKVYDNPLWKYLPRTGNGISVDEKNCDFTHPMAIKHGYSWKPSENKSTEIKSAVYSPGYEEADQTEDAPKRYVVDLRHTLPNGVEESAFATSSVKWGDTEKGSNPMGDWRTKSANIHLGEGHIQQVVQLFAGEYINLIVCQDLANDTEWIAQKIGFELSIEPFTENIDWLQMESVELDERENGSSKEGETMNWGDAVQYMQDQIDLVGFLPKEVKIDDWVSNFCKAFNLELLHIQGKDFALNVKEKNIMKNTSLIIDLDNKTNVHQAENATLALPRAYKLGYTIDTAEEGYVASIPEGKAMTEGDMGGGRFETGSDENNEVEQKSNFSHCWYKTLEVEKMNANNQKEKTKIAVPIITDHEIWTPQSNPKETQKKHFLIKLNAFGITPAKQNI